MNLYEKVKAFTYSKFPEPFYNLYQVKQLAPNLDLIVVVNAQFGYDELLNQKTRDIFVNFGLLTPQYQNGLPQSDKYVAHIIQQGSNQDDSIENVFKSPNSMKNTLSQIDDQPYQNLDTIIIRLNDIFETCDILGFDYQSINDEIKKLQ